MSFPRFKLAAFAAFMICLAGPAAAGPVIAAVASFSSWLSTAGALATFGVNLAAGMALSLIQVTIQKNKMGKQKEPGISSQSTTAGGNAAQSFVMGRYATGGHLEAPMMTYQTDGNPNEWLVYVISLGDLPISGLRSIIVDGKQHTFEAPPHATGDGLGVTVVDPDFHNKIYLRFHDGKQTVADQYLMKVFADYPERPWRSDMVFSGVPYVVMTFKGKSQDNLWQGFPAVRFEVDGIPLYDPRDPEQDPNDPDTWKHSTNLAVMAFNALRGIRMGSGDVWGMGAGSFMLERCISAMNVCDEQVPTASGTRTRYRGGIEVTVDQEPSDIIDELVKGFSGMYADEGGTWSVRAGPFDAPELSITDASVLISRSTSFTPFRGLMETVNAVHGSYPEPAALWNAREAVPIYNLAWELEDRRRLQTQVNFPAVWDGRQVRALLREFVTDGRRQRVHSLSLPRSAAGLRLGSIIRWSSVLNYYSNKLFEVTDKVVDTSTLICEYILREVDPADYSPNTGSDSVLPTIPGSDPVVPDVRGVFGWDAFAVTIEGDTGQRAGIRMIWSPEIGATGISWKITHVASGMVVSSGTTLNIQAGAMVIESGLLPSTAYDVVGQLVMNRRTTETAARRVVTNDIRISRDELPQSILDDLATLEGWADQAVADLLQDIADLQAESDRISTEVEAARDLLGSEVDRLELEMAQNLSSAQGFVETGIDEYRTEVSGLLNAMTGRIDELTAALTSENLVTNGSFVIDAASWTLTAATHVVKTGSTDNLVLASPSEGMLSVGVSAVGSLSQTLQNFEVGPDDRIQYRFSVASTGSRNIRVTLSWLDGAGAPVGSPVSTQYTIPAGQWTKVNGQADPPDTAKSAVLLIEKIQTGVRALITNIEVTTINVAIEAKIATLEATQATLSSTLASLSSSVNTRFQQATAAIQTEASTRASEDGALSSLLSTMRSDFDGQQATITEQATTIANALVSITQTNTRLEAYFDKAELVRDPEFTFDLLHWRGTPTPTVARLAARNPTHASAIYNAMPGKKAFRFQWDDTGRSIYTEALPCSPGQQFILSAYVWRQVNAPAPRIFAQFFNASGELLSGPYLEVSTTGAWTLYTSPVIEAPAGTTDARVFVGYGQVTGTANSTFLTQLSLKRLGGADARVMSTIDEVKQTAADTDSAFNSYRTIMDARVNDIDGPDGRLASHATMIADRFTKAATNQAISSGIQSFSATLQPTLDAKATAQSVTLANARIDYVDGRVTSQGNWLTEVSAQTNESSATGRLLMQAYAAGADSVTRIGMQVRASRGASPGSAAMFIEALSNGQGRATVVANRFAVVTAETANAPRKVPFYIANNQVYIDSAVIKEATIGTLHLANGAVVGAYTFQLGGSNQGLTLGEVQRFVINLPEPGYRGIVFSRCTSMSLRDRSTISEALIQVNGNKISQSESNGRRVVADGGLPGGTDVYEIADGNGVTNFVQGNNVVRLLARNTIAGTEGVRYVVDILVFKR